MGVIDRRRLAQHREGTFRNLKYLNVARRFPYPDSRFQYIYSSHMIEHLHPSVAEHCILECGRVLAPGGVARITLPDLDQIVASYNPRNPRIALDVIFELGVNGSKNRHWWHYNEVSLAQLLLQSGFRAAYRCEHGVSRYGPLRGLDNRPGSLIMEAVK